MKCVFARGAVFLARQARRANCCGLGARAAIGKGAASAVPIGPTRLGPQVALHEYAAKAYDLRSGDSSGRNRGEIRVSTPKARRRRMPAVLRGELLLSVAPRAGARLQIELFIVRG